MEKKWLDWLNENLERGCDPQELHDILMENKIPLPHIKKAMGKKFPQGHKGVAPLADTAVSGTLDHKALSVLPVARMELESGFERIDTQDKVQLFTITNFMSAKECDALVEVIHQKLEPSGITTYAEGFRTSKTSHLVVPHAIVLGMNAKICATLGIHISYSESTQAQKYEVGQEFKPHTDFFEPGTEEYTKYAGPRGNRTWTFMIYLNDTPKGGGTRFTHLDKTMHPKKGMALIWNNLHSDGSVNYDTEHWGMPVEKGEKVIITKWFREQGTGPMFMGMENNPVIDLPYKP